MSLPAAALIIFGCLVHAKASSCPEREPLMMWMKPRASCMLQLQQAITERATDNGELMQPDQGLKDIFDDIANHNKWGDPESVSGLGSELASTAPVRACLSKWIKKYHVETFVDVPCGDANWQASIPGIENTIYKGYDIADLPLERARLHNANHTFMSFGLLDLSSQVPSEKPDIIMVRDVIQHVPLQTGWQMLVNAQKSGARYLAVSTFPDTTNIEIPAGQFYENNVHASPFNLPASIESCHNDAESLGVWQSDYLELIDMSTWDTNA